MNITPWEKRLLFQLGWQVRAFAVSQLARAHGFSPAQMKRKVNRLAAKQLIRTMRLTVADFRLARPLVVWPSPNFERALRAAPYQLARRWRSLRWKHDHVLWIAPRGIALCGGFGGRLRQRLQLQHDLGTAQVFLRKSQSEQANWMGEDWLRRTDGPLTLLRKVPDAVIRNEQEQLTKAVEFGGRYKRSALQAFSRHCRRLELPHEIW